MFQLDKHEASIANVNQRIQRHGEERQLAADIKFVLSVSNEALDSFDSTLRHDLFRKPAKGEQQDLPQIGGDGLTAVKHPALEPLKLSHEFTGYEMHLAGLLETADPIILVDVKLKRFVIEPKEGGSLAMSFTASAEVEPQELAELSEALIREDVLLTLLAPKRGAAVVEDLTEGGDTLDAQDNAAAAAEAASLIDAGKKAAA
ncbi:hypothetical protein [Xanthomonas floridensis]|jgi:hypothetical protein|uniref:Uncharacterized protein n=1 Tax=Xanthomonas floridensis TaxID=1843580 RepID=A0A1A9MDK7_9XANT|nr:hypothetical protein [Xanthomonas floridensis]MEA5123268.1 hypothetical protein [Xanthomonas floridensis]MEA5132765.1 hypothetical protein [Xanthomonas floridensis]OAG67670.1 hypothetical protein A7D17_15895 [Xanthomonas floridensis]